MPITYLDEEKPTTGGAKITYLDEAPKTSEKTMGNALTGKVSEEAYNSGERNLLGNLVDRPAAAVRSLLMGKGFTQGAVNPTNVPTFQDVLLDKFAPKTASFGKNVTGGVIPSAVGFGLDMITNPSNLLTALIPEAPLASQALKALSATKPALLASKVGNYPLEQLPNLVKQGLQPDLVKNVANLERKVSSIIQEGITKGIRPAVTGKQTASMAKSYFNKAEKGIRTIILNKDNLAFDDGTTGRLPKNLNEFAQAIEQTKEAVYKEYSSLAKETPLKFDIKPALQKLSSVAEDINFNPQTRQYAKGLLSDVAELHNADALTVQNRIKDLNLSLKGFYAGRTDAAKAQVDASVANLLREQLDDMINKSTGENYQPLKNVYGSLKSIEKEVNQRAIVSSRQNPKSIFDLTDIFSGGQILHGALSANPASIASGVGMNLIKNTYKKFNNPNYIVEKMFSNADKLMAKGANISAKIPQAITPELMPDKSSLDALMGNKERLPYLTKQIGVDEFKKLPEPKTKYGENFTARNTTFQDYINMAKNKKTNKAINKTTTKDKQNLQQGRQILRDRWSED